jgi:hypothetical protein
VLSLWLHSAPIGTVFPVVFGHPSGCIGTYFPVIRTSFRLFGRRCLMSDYSIRTSNVNVRIEPQPEKLSEYNRKNCPNTPEKLSESLYR